MEQITFDHMTKSRFVIDKPIRLIELFAGIGAQAKALERIGADFEHYRVCEFDRFAVKSYNAVHGTVFETSDICKWTGADLGICETDKYCYILTYSFPCTDLSLAGKREGMSKDGGTRSGLLWEVERLLTETAERPQVLLMENVPQVHGQDNAADFRKWIMFLESLGYNNYYEDLNATGFGIPQNRERTFMVSVLGDYFYTFPTPTPLKQRLKDRLETEVDEKYYLSDEQVGKLLGSSFTQEQTRIQSGGVLPNPMCERLEIAAVCRTVRIGGRGSIDRHSWDVIIDDSKNDKP